MVRAAGLIRFMSPVDVVSMTSPCGVGEFEQIVDRADHRPLGSDLVDAPRAELTEAWPNTGSTICFRRRRVRRRARLSFVALAALREPLGHSLGGRVPGRGQVAGDSTAGKLHGALLVVVARRRRRHPWGWCAASHEYR
jgi:hypothetical protein